MNYRQSHGVWFPYKTDRSRTSNPISIDQSWSEPLRAVYTSEGEDDIDVFFKTTNMIVSLNYHLLVYLYERSNGETRS